jgi:hypothetical protein
MISRRQFNKYGTAMMAGLAAAQGTAFASEAADENGTTPVPDDASFAVD